MAHFFRILLNRIMQAVAARLHAMWVSDSPGSPRILGVVLMAAAMLIIPSADRISKYLSSDHAPLCLGWACYAAGAAFIVPAALMTSRGDRIMYQQVPLQFPGRSRRTKRGRWISCTTSWRRIGRGRVLYDDVGAVDESPGEVTVKGLA